MLSISLMNAQPLKSFGIKGGITLANQAWSYSTSTTLETQNRMGTVVGIFVEGFRVSNFSMLAELWYQQKGFKTMVPSQSHPGEMESAAPQLDYGSLAFSLKYKFPGDVLSPYLFAGPHWDLLGMTAKRGYKPAVTVNKVGNGDLGITGGIGSEFNIGIFKNVLAEFRYSPSLIDTFKDDTLSVKNNSIEFVVGISF